jgi:glycine cleavage system H protein
MSLYYAESHEWAEIDGKVATIGISDHAQHELGDIVFIELPEVGKKVAAGKVLCEVESVKAVSEIYAPVSGTVTEINEELSDAPEKINEDARANWICKMQIDSIPTGLLSEAEYLKKQA